MHGIAVIKTRWSWTTEIVKGSFLLYCICTMYTQQETPEGEQGVVGGGGAMESQFVSAKGLYNNR